MAKRLTDTEVSDLLGSVKPWNIARRLLANAAATLSRDLDEISPIEWRRREFQAVADIVAVFGIDVAPKDDADAAFSIELIAADPDCRDCQGKGTVWRGGQGGDYEICDCRIGARSNEPFKAPGGYRIEEARAEIARGARTAGEPFRLGQGSGAVPAGKPPGSSENVP